VAKSWLVSLACREAKELGYPHELWPTRLLARHDPREPRLIRTTLSEITRGRAMGRGARKTPVITAEETTAWLGW
jgi:hypothetical protein